MKKILMFILLFVVLSASCTPFSTNVPTVTPTSSGSNAVETIDTFYTLINNAQTENDLVQPWHMMTLEEQCNPRDQCMSYRFQDRWWPNKVLYKLYDCGSNSVVAQEMQYPRDADVSAAGNAQYWKYQLVEAEDAMLISDIRKAQVPGNDCVLVTN
jgi:hypothetical protein